MAERSTISLLELQTFIKDRLQETVPLPFWVTAEISELKVNYSGHCYLELVEKGGRNQVPKARANAVIWRSAFGAIGSYFRSETGTELAEGMQVLLRVAVSYHELYGLSLVVSDIDPLYTLGDMERRRQETINRLKEEGVFEMNRSLELPPVIQRIAVVSSRGAAGYRDFMNELESSAFRFETTLFDAVMQGHAMEESVVAALESICDAAGDFDAVAIIRGGGAQSDLAAFDSYRLASHIAQFPLPVLTGIGHDKDESVADMVAAVPLKTPTAVAGWLIEGLAGVDAWLDQTQDEIVRIAVTLLDDGKRRLKEMAFALSSVSSEFRRKMELRLEKFAGVVALRAGSRLTRESAALENVRLSLMRRYAARLERENTRLDHASGLAESRRPDRILSLGFAIVRRDGRAVVAANALSAGDTLDITFARGGATAEVKNTDHGEE